MSKRSKKKSRSKIQEAQKNKFRFMSVASLFGLLTAITILSFIKWDIQTVAAVFGVLWVLILAVLWILRNYTEELWEQVHEKYFSRKWVSRTILLFSIALTLIYSIILLFPFNKITLSDQSKLISEITPCNIEDKIVADTSANGTYIAFVANQPEICIVRQHDSSLYNKYIPYTADIGTLCFMEQDKLLTAHHGRIYVISEINGEILDPNPSPEITICAPTADGIATQDDDNNLQQIRFENNAANEIWATPIGSKITAIAVTPDGLLIAAGTGDGDIFLVDAESGVVVQHIMQEFDEPIVDIEFRFDFHQALGAASANAIKIIQWDDTTFDTRREIKDEGENITTIAFNPTDSDLILVGGRSLKVWDTEPSEAKVVEEFEEAKPSIWVGYNTDGTFTSISENGIFQRFNTSYAPNNTKQTTATPTIPTPATITATPRANNPPQILSTLIDGTCARFQGVVTWQDVDGDIDHITYGWADGVFINNFPVSTSNTSGTWTSNYSPPSLCGDGSTDTGGQCQLQFEVIDKKGNSSGVSLATITC